MGGTNFVVGKSTLCCLKAFIPFKFSGGDETAL